MKIVLVIDDVPEVAVLLKTKLERTERFKVFSAGGGKEGLRLAEEVRPDIIICDIDMPGMDGPAIAAKIGEKPATRNIPLIFLSSLVTPQDITPGSARPMVSKQSPIEQLIKTIDAVLARSH